jgi:hypothetical protein
MQDFTKCYTQILHYNYIYKISHINVMRGYYDDDFNVKYN